MVVPVRDQAREQVRAAQERAVGRRRAAEHEVVAAARADVAAVDHELLAAQPRLPRGVVQEFGVVDEPSKLLAGWMFTSITPGSGVTCSSFSRASRGGG